MYLSDKEFYEVLLGPDWLLIRFKWRRVDLMASGTKEDVESARDMEKPSYWPLLVIGIPRTDYADILRRL